MNNSLKIIQNKDKSYTAEWDKKDPMWSFMNNFTEKQIQCIIHQAIEEDKKGK